MQYDNIYKIKENKKDNNLKTQNLITSTQSRVPNNNKIHQPKVEMQEKIFKKKKNPPKMREKNNLLYEENKRDKERNNILYVKKLLI